MRTRYKRDTSRDPFLIEFKGRTYDWRELEQLARKSRQATHIHESVCKVSTGEYIYLTQVSDEDTIDAYGSGSGWYLVEELTPKQAELDIQLLEKFTALYQN